MPPYEFQTAFDCEVLLALWREKGPAFLAELDGIFAFALWDHDQRRYLVALGLHRRLPALHRA